MNHRASAALLWAFCFGFTSLALAEMPDVPADVDQLMKDRKYAEAVERLDKAIDGAATKNPDYLLYLKGRALHFQQQHNQAVEAFDLLLAKYPKSDWARRARFAKGVSFARKGDFRAADVIYRQEAEFLLGADRKQEIADIYLEFADAHFDPDKDDAKPDYQKALEFYQKALQVGPKPQSRVETELAIARCYQHLGKHGEAAEKYREFLKEHEDHELAIEARFRLGEALLAGGQSEQARRAWQDLLKLHEGADSPWLPEAAFHLGKTYHLPQPQSREQLDLGVAALRSFLEKHPDHKLASEAHLQIAQSYYNFGEYGGAVERLKTFLASDKYADTKEIPEARFLLGHAYKMQAKFDEAIAAWSDFLVKHPTHSSWSDAQQNIVNAEYLKAQTQYNDENYDAARRLWSEFLAKHPLDSRSPQILYLLGQTHHAQQQWDEAIGEWRRLTSKYPNSSEAAKAQYMIAVTMEEKLEKLEEALEEYRKIKQGPYASHAQQRIAQLTAKQLTVATERVFRSDETPKIDVATRNQESVQVSVYSVDLQTYFRKMHLATGVEQLDIALIDPDTDFEFTVPDYEKHRKIEFDIETPLIVDDEPREAGVTAVTVTASPLQATTLIVQSDLDIIVKSSRDEVFVFAQNLRTGKPWSGATILVSNGQEVFLEGTTNDDGVYRQTSDKLKDAQDVRVFAASGGHVASNVIGLSGVGVSRGLARKGYIYTERPAYQPGQVVHLRGVIRTVDGDTYTIPKDTEYHVEVFDSRSRLLHDAKVSLSDFGSFHSHFALPTAVGLGTCRVLVQDVDKKESYQGAFVVQKYQLQPIQLVVDTARTVFYRGEEISGTIRAEYYYGAPLVGRELRYSLADGRVHTATTDEKGEVKFSLPTRDYRETQTLGLAVVLTEQNLQTSKNFFLATQGFTLSASTVRPVYLSGETFDVKVEAKDAEGEPIAVPLTMKVLKHTQVGRKSGESLVEQRELKTADDGRAHVTLKLADGANYTLRVQGTDRFGNPVTTETQVEISGENDDVRLRILADRHNYKVGDTANVEVHWREAPALALVTYEGANILDYRLVTLKQGANILPVPMTSKLAPNFELALAVMTRHQPNEEQGEDGEEKPSRRFHSASSPFRVTRNLDLEIAVKAKDGGEAPRPGEEVEVSVTAKDPQGNPVVAELSLAMVEQSLLNRFPSSLEAIDEFFRGARRESDMRTTSSVVFSYHPTTKPINERLLAEADRLALAATESLHRRAHLSDLSIHDSFSLGVEQEQEMATPEAANAPAYGDEMMAEMMVQGQPVPPPASGQPQADPFAYSQSGAFAGRFGGQAANGAPRPTISFDPSGAPSADLDLRQVESKSLRQQPRHYWQDYDFQAIDRNGVWYNVPQTKRGSQWNEEAAEKLAEELAGEGAVLMPNLVPHETGYWNPALVTDENGKAVANFTLPGRSTAWRLLAKGVTKDTLAGDAEHNFIVKKPLFGQLKLPAALVDGDKATVIATVHTDSKEKLSAELSLAMTVGGKTVVQKKGVEAAAGVTEVMFPIQINLPEDSKSAANVDAAFELAVSSGDKQDLVTRSLPVLPAGLPVFAIAGGSAGGDAAAVVEPPEDMPLTSPSLQVVIGPTVEQSLIDVVLGAPSCQLLARQQVASGLVTTASDLMASIALQRLLSASRDAASPEAASLDARIRSSLATLVAQQRDDGGWSWTGGAGQSDRYASARALWGLSLAKGAGYRVERDTFNKAATYVESQLSQTRVSDYDTKAVLLHALAEADRGDFPMANQLYRNRPSLSVGGLAYLALSFLALDRQATAMEILDSLAEKGFSGDAPLQSPEVICWCGSETELRALYAWGLVQASAEDARLSKAVDWLLANRTGNRWSPDQATGPAMLALCGWQAKGPRDPAAYNLTVYVNNLKAAELQFDQSSRTETIDIPAELLQPGKAQRVRLEMTGRGRYTYQCVLSGFVPDDKLKSTTTRWDVNRYRTPAPLELDGQTIPSGFDVVAGSYNSFRNNLTEMPMGGRGHVELHVYRRNTPSSTPDEQLEYLVVTEPLPAGASVVESSIRGGFERYELQPGAIIFYLGNSRGFGAIHYDIHGYLPGEYAALPTVVRNAHRPDEMAVEKSEPLEVLPRGAASKDEYRLTPRELYELGRRHFEKGELAAAAEHLTQLVQNWNLKNEFHKEACRMLLDVHLKNGPASQVVTYFEIIIVKYHDVEIPFAKLLSIGDAYHRLGEYERSYMVFRTLVEAGFQRESQAAGFLDSQGEFLRSVEVMSSLLKEYPPEPYVAAAEYALAQQVYAKAPQASEDEKLRERKITRVDLIRRAIDRLDTFLTAWPEDPAADQASFSLANGLLDLEAYEQAIAACQTYAERFPQSEFLDAYWYIIGFCRFARGEHEQALAMCRKVAEAERVDPKTGRRTESDNKWRAIYIMGQVHHSLDEAQAAIEDYRRVDDRFPDAREAIEYFLEKDISLPEVTTIRPGEDVALELSFRNIARCETAVYRIDLMKFSLLRRSLANITAINLAGIRPYYEGEVALGDGKDYRDRTHSLKLPLKEEGAYLVVCRGDNLHASGLALVTPLTLEVNEGATEGRLRATIRNVIEDRYVPEVHVKAIGTRNDEFMAGESDLRGVFTADGIRGKSMVIAQADGGRYAFFRGVTELGPPPEPAAQPQSQSQSAGEDAAKAEAAPSESGKTQLLKGLQMQNSAIQSKQGKQLQDLYQNNVEEGIGGGFGGGGFGGFF